MLSVRRFQLSRAKSLAFLMFGFAASSALAQTARADAPDTSAVGWQIAAGFLVVGVAVLALASFFVMRALKARRQAAAATQWPVTQATITLSEVQKRRRSTGGGKNRSRTTKTTYAPVVHYRYAVNGASYETDRISFGGDGQYSFLSSAEKVTEKYPEGSTVAVRYDPTHPAVATIETSAGGTIGPILIGSVLSLFGIAAFLIGALTLIASFA